MRKLLVLASLLFVAPAFAQDYNIPFSPRAAAAATQPSQTGTVLEFDTAAQTNTGTLSSTITVPDDATFMVVGVSSYQGSVANYYSGGSMTMTKGGSAAAMTSAITGVGSGDNTASSWCAAMFYMVAPDTGANKTLAWDWSGTSTFQVMKVSVTFWKGVNQTTPVRSSVGGGQAGGLPYTTSALTNAATNDLILTWVGAFSSAEGSCSTWSNAALLSQIAKNSDADGAWSTDTTPTANQTVACSTAAVWEDGGIVAISMIPQ